MNKFSLIFPIATLLLIALFYLGLPRLKACSLQGGEKSFSHKDFLLLGLIVILYTAVAFYNLGDKKAPESFAHFDKDCESVIIDLGKEQNISLIRYYPGLNTGSYELKFSSDGRTWRTGATMAQGHAELFKWLEAEFNEALPFARYVKLVPDSELYLGELVIYSGNEMIEPAACDYPELFDEKELVPDEASYLNSTYFDEIYHARTALEHIEGIYPYELSHPPLGKIIISLGISLFGMTPFGWRFMGTLFGVLMLPVLYVLLKKMFGGISVPACGTAIFAFDFMHFTQTRIATIDTYAVFFILLMYLFMYLYVEGGRLRHLALSGLFFGLGAASKWTCIYAGGGLAVIWLAHWIFLLKSKEKRLRDFIGNCLFCLVFFVLVPALIYYLSYTPYGIAAGMHAPNMYFDRSYAKIVLGNQDFMFSYHSGVNSEHPYSSRWYQWIIDQRPILYYLHYFEDGTRSSFGAFLNPVLCWAGLTAVFIMAWLSFTRKDKKAAFILIGYLAQLLPWVFIGRTTFEYHYFTSSVFLLLALCYVFSMMEENKSDWKVRVYGLTGLSLALFAAFYPVLSGMTVKAELASRLLKWFPSWPF